MIPTGDWTRISGVLVADGEIMLIRRVRDGERYFTLPGGHLENGDSHTDTLVREFAEETEHKVEVGRLLYRVEVRGRETARLPAKEYIYMCTLACEKTMPRLCEGPERAYGGVRNLFEPRWVTVSELSHKPLLSRVVKDWLIYDLERGFQNIEQDLFIELDSRVQPVSLEE